MDARLDPAKYAGLAEGDAHVIRNAGGRASLTVEPRSVYLLSGPARAVWEHSIPALDRLPCESDSRRQFRRLSSCGFARFGRRRHFVEAAGLDVIDIAVDRHVAGN